MAIEADLARCCLNCHATAAAGGGSLKACGGCRKVRYCSTECQKKHRSQHKVFARPSASIDDSASAWSGAAEPELIETGCFGSACMCAFRKHTNNLLERTHVLAMAFELNESWTEEDSILHRYKVKSGAAVRDAYVEQHLTWAGMQTKTSEGVAELATVRQETVAHYETPPMKGWKPETWGSVNYFSGDPSAVRYDENWVTTLGSDLKVGTPSPSLLCFSGSRDKSFGVLGGFLKGSRRAEIHA
ncbi:hypothetical protein BCR35DRAFT_332567 [Leucosporidium creatinivorum]|uniref:MYND-type domain-containing protein n=1 Tax=Leucosporidium creatinivorum TaxID=106004 RepID=A0A1Y2F2D8_9BASI|nr:hypothetical protein BCR35DRAFT_332567 [Leucosporidium creatinivorum]